MGSLRLTYSMMKAILLAAFLSTLAIQVDLAALDTRDPYDCPDGDGIHPDPENCQCFYDCANDVPYHECCSAGTMFDATTGTCNFDDQVECGDRPMPGSTRPPTQSPTPSHPTDPTKPTDPTQPTQPTDGSTAPTQPTPGTTSQAPRPPGPGLPKKVLGMYILLADDTEDDFHDDADWEPLLYPYQQEGANVLFFTFINPETMEVPLSFKKLAASRGTNAEGAVPADTVIMFAIGGYAYSLHPNPWEWLTSRDKAEAMAVEVAKWKDLYGIDGIDLDIEEGAGSQGAAGPNMVHFIRKLKQLQPDWLVSQPTYGYPQIAAEIDVINASWNVGGSSNGLADTIGLMVYEGTQALQYVKNFAEGSSQWEGFPIKVDVPKPDILLGCKGSSSSGTIDTLAKESVKQDLLGIMVWFCSVQNGLVYGHGWDCQENADSQNGYVAALKYMQDNS